MDNVYVYLVDDIPTKTHEMTTPCADGYTVYIDARLNHESQLKAYEHALKHIKNGDFDIEHRDDNVQAIELSAHEPSQVTKVDKFEKEIEKLSEERKKIKYKLRHYQKRRKFLESIDYDFFAAAERRYLDPEA